MDPVSPKAPQSKPEEEDAPATSEAIHDGGSTIDPKPAAATTKQSSPLKSSPSRPPPASRTATSTSAADTERHFNTARTPRHCNRGPNSGEKRGSLNVVIPSTEGNGRPAEAAAGGQEAPAGAGGPGGPAGGPPGYGAYPGPGRQPGRWPPRPPHPDPRYTGYEGYYPHDEAPPPYHEAHYPPDPRYAPPPGDTRYAPYGHDVRYDPRYGYPPHEPYHEPSSRGRPARGYYDHAYEAPPYPYYGRERGYSNATSQEGYPREASHAVRDREVALNDNLNSEPKPRTSSIGAATGGSVDQGSLHAVSSSFSDGKSLKSAEPPAQDNANATTAGKAVAAKQSPGVVTRGGSVESSEADKDPSAPSSLPNQPSLKSHEEEEEEEEEDAQSDSSWKQLQQVASVDRDEMLRLRASKSELTAATIKPSDNEGASGGVSSGANDAEGGKGQDEEATEAATPAKTEGEANKESNAAEAPTKHDSPTELRQVPSGLSRTSSLSNSPTEEEYRPPPPHHHPHAHPSQAHHPRGPPPPHYPPQYAYPRGQHLSARPPPPAYYGHPHDPARRPPWAPAGPYHPYYAPQDDNSPSASTISTKASLATLGGGGGGGPTEPAFFGKDHPPAMKPKHPFLKKARDESHHGEDGGPEAKRRKLPEASADDDKNPSPTLPTEAADPAQPLDGRVMATSPNEHSAHGGEFGSIGAVPSWETAGKPLAGWSVCSGMTGDTAGRMEGGALGTAFSFTEGIRSDGHNGGAEGEAAGNNGGEEEGQDPSPKSILSKVGEKRKNLAPGTHVQFSRESKRGAHGARPPPSSSGPPPPPPQDEYYYEYPRHGGGYAYDGYARPGPPPPRSYYEEDPYYDPYYGHPHHPPPPGPYGYHHPPPPRHSSRSRGPPPPHAEYPPPSRSSMGSDRRPTIHTPPDADGPRHHHPNPHRPPAPPASAQFSHRSHGTKAQRTTFLSDWDKDDDAALMALMKKHKATVKKWEPIAQKLGRNKSARDCQERWTRYLKPGARKGQWTEEEDRIVLAAVRDAMEEPFTRWSELAARLPGRVGKQVRDRYVNHLNPAINHLPFGRDDDLLLWEGHRVLGKRWVEISARYFKGSRSENHIKNRWYSASFKKFIAKEFGPDAYQTSNEVRKRALQAQAAAEAAGRDAALDGALENGGRRGPPIVSGHGANI